ncbi:MAG: carboxypeptidase-like regulatory domain-containing protein [Candidatus Limnocylindrales bacterium]
MRGAVKVSWRWLAALVLVAAVVVVLAATAQRAGQTPGASGQSPEPTPAGPIAYVVGSVTAGPVCPVVQSPAPSSCDPRPVAGAVITVSFADQGEVARATTAADGSYRITIHGYGTVTVTALPLAGLMGAPAPVTVTLEPTETRRLDFDYDTGIR